MIRYTTVDELLEFLTYVKDTAGGDTAVAVNGRSPIYMDDKPWYYDGGMQAADIENRKFVSSKNYTNHPEGLCTKEEGFPNRIVVLFPLEYDWEDEDEI